MSVTCKKTSPITAVIVAEENRMDFFPTFFGPKLWVLGEPLICQWMGVLAEGYNGSNWNYYTLSNGGFYMAPETDKRFKVVVVSNYFSKEMSADAAGIVATLYALGNLANRTENDRIIELYQALYEYANGHAERELMLEAIA